MDLEKDGGARKNKGMPMERGYSARRWPDGRLYAEKYLTDDGKGIGFEIFYDYESQQPEIFKAIYGDHYFYAHGRGFCGSLEGPYGPEDKLKAVEYTMWFTKPRSHSEMNKGVIRAYGCCSQDIYVPAAIHLKDVREKELALNKVWSDWEVQKASTEGNKQEVIAKGAEAEQKIQEKFTGFAKFLPKGMTYFDQVEIAAQNGQVLREEYEPAMP